MIDKALAGADMKDTTKEDQVIQRLTHWAEERKSVRAVLLTSTRTNPNAPQDLFSDYDVVLVVTDIRPFFGDRTWLEDFGRVLVVYRDPIQPDHGIGTFAYITQYEDGTKIDFSLWPVELLRRIVADPELPEDLDIGYMVLLDKDGMTSELKLPTHAAYIPAPPTRAAYENVIEEFFHEATYVAKHLWRDDLMAAKYNLDKAMKLDNLRKMLEWRMEIDHDWSVRPGAYGRGLKKRLKPETWLELESTYVGAGIEENWDALFRTLAFFRQVAIEVGDHLGYPYPYDLDQRVMLYLRKVQNLDHGAKSFP
jgi:aminoglycoside 6-adenylyltransferase